MTTYAEKLKHPLWQRMRKVLDSREIQGDIWQTVVDGYRPPSFDRLVNPVTSEEV